MSVITTKSPVTLFACVLLLGILNQFNYTIQSDQFIVGRWLSTGKLNGENSLGAGSEFLFEFTDDGTFYYSARTEGSDYYVFSLKYEVMDSSKIQIFGDGFDGLVWEVNRDGEQLNIEITRDSIYVFRRVPTPKAEIMLVIVPLIALAIRAFGGNVKNISKQRRIKARLGNLHKNTMVMLSVVAGSLLGVILYKALLFDVLIRSWAIVLLVEIVILLAFCWNIYTNLLSLSRSQLASLVIVFVYWSITSMMAVIISLGFLWKILPQR